MAGRTPTPPPGTTVAGVDGCRTGWLVVRWSSAAGARASIEPDIGPVVAALRSGELAAVAIDMPIGLLDDRPRACDRLIRARLGVRRSSVFPAPLRTVLAATDYEDACRRSRDVAGFALSRQAFNLVPKIAELDAVVRPEDQDRLVEAHPECAFARLAGAPLADPKRTAAGRAVRRTLLSDADPALAALVAGDRSAGGTTLPELDLLDAAALTITACRIAAGTAERLGDDVDRRGLRAEAAC